MKKMILCALLLSSFAQAASPKIVEAPLKHLYVPVGFDNNDTVEVIVTGEFPNTCYSRNKSTVTVAEDKIYVDITAIVNEESRLDCADMMVPFKEVISLGNLQGGEYDIVVNGKAKFALTDKITIAEAESNSVDEHTYAAIEYVEKVGKNDFLLKGISYSDCMKLDKIEVLSNKKDTLSVLPVLKQVSNFCPMKGIPVSYQVQLDVSELKTKEPLIHIRTMDGKSVNSILNLTK